MIVKRTYAGRMVKGKYQPVCGLFYEDLDEADNIEVIRKLLVHSKLH